MEVPSRAIETIVESNIRFITPSCDAIKMRIVRGNRLKQFHERERMALDQVSSAQFRCRRVGGSTVLGNSTM
jgi:hypothetical protein